MSECSPVAAGLSQPWLAQLGPLRHWRAVEGLSCEAAISGFQVKFEGEVDSYSGGHGCGPLGALACVVKWPLTPSSGSFRRPVFSKILAHFRHSITNTAR